VAGWYAGSPRPGAIGSSVIVGHVDSRLGPGVFFRLGLLRPAERIYVRRGDGSVAVFRVSSVHTYLKSRFPTAAVYGPAPGPQLRLITCGGAFDPAVRSYLSNVVVYAVGIGRMGQSSPRPTGSRAHHQRQYRHPARSADIHPQHCSHESHQRASARTQQPHRWNTDAARCESMFHRCRYAACSRMGRGFQADKAAHGGCSISGRGGGAWTASAGGAGETCVAPVPGQPASRRASHCTKVPIGTLWHV
jgi:Sortase domain